MLRIRRHGVALSIASLVAFTLANDVLAWSFSWTDERRHTWAAAIALPYLVTMSAAILGGVYLFSERSARLSERWAAALPSLVCAASIGATWLAALAIRGLPDAWRYVFVPIAFMAPIAALFTAGGALAQLVRAAISLVRWWRRRAREPVPAARVVHDGHRLR